MALLCYLETRKRQSLTTKKRRIPWHVEINITVLAGTNVPVVKNVRVDQSVNALIANAQTITNIMATKKNTIKKNTVNKKG